MLFAADAAPTLWERFELKIKALSEDPEVEWVDVIDLPGLLRKEQPRPGISD